ncbi:MAG: tetratricopeptide repeat protein, partial [Woeseiaceae bacterium]|nr:tetratricopeptide repeat protein [Woeseiaceae bacterium]
LVLFGIERVFFNDPAVAPATSATRGNIDENSIAVLAFEDLSPDGDHEYFADGLSEELLNVLAKVDHLKVAGRTSSFAFKGQNRDLREIGEILQVAHILEGSVRKAGNRIRVTAQLIEASTGFHLYSETYDRDLDDVFAVQDEIASEISAALLTEISGTESIKPALQTDPEAYELYLLARQRLHTRDIIAMQEADTMLNRALAIDPQYAPALAQKAMSTYLLSDGLGAYGTTPEAEAIPAAHALVDRALAIDPKLPEALAVRGLLYDSEDRTTEGIEVLETAVSLNPNLSDAQNWLANALARLGRQDESLAIYEGILSRDPLYGPAFSNLVGDYSRRGHFDKADALIQRLRAMVGDNDEISMASSIASVMRGENARAAREIQLAYDENPNSTVMRMWYGFGLLGIGDWEDVIAKGDPSQQFYARGMLASQDEIDGLIENFNVMSVFPPRTLRYIGHLYHKDHRFEDHVDYIERTFGSLDDLLSRFSIWQPWFPEWKGELAYSYLQVGDEASYRRLRDDMQAAIEDEDAKGTNNWVSAWGKCQLAALDGDLEGLLAEMRAALDIGLVRPDVFNAPIFDFARGDARFQALNREILAEVDAQRAELGLPPYRPIDLTDDEQPASFVN